MKIISHSKISVLLMAQIFIFNLFSGPIAMAETIEQTSITSQTEIAFRDQRLDFPSFFRPSDKNCLGLNCDWRDSSFGHGFIDYPMCEESDGKNCLRTIELSSQGSSFSKLTFVGEIEWKKINISSSSFDMKGGAPSVWTSKDVKGIQSYFLVKVFSGFSWRDSDPSLNKIEMRIARVNLVEQGAGNRYCLVGQSAQCFKEDDFDLDSRLRVAMSVPLSIGGFFMGRIGDPEVQQKQNKVTRQNSLTITANPIKVPVLSVVVPDSENIPVSLSNIGKGLNSFPNYDGEWNDEFDFAKKFTNDRVTGYTTQWTFYAMGSDSTDYAACARTVSGIIGSGTTNAMRYDYNPPVFKDGSFIFKLSGLHYQPDGRNLELGFYELVLNTQFAKCLYKSNNAPLMARIEITSENGEKNITSTVSQERDGWFRLKIAALTFSSKVIKVSFSSQMQKSIQCKKGTIKKTIKGLKPTCPSGWKIVKAN